MPAAMAAPTAGFVDAVDHDLVGAVGAVGQSRFDAAAQRGAIGVGGRGLEPLVARADLAAAAGDAAGKRRDHARQRCDRLDRPAGRGQAAAAWRPCRIMLPPATPLSTSTSVFDQELAVHDRNSPVAAAADLLALLKAVAEEADVSCPAESRLRRAAGRRTRPSWGRSSRTGRRDWAPPWPGRRSRSRRPGCAAPGRPSGVSSGESGRSTPVSLSQAITAVAGELVRGGGEPMFVVGGDDQPHVAHAKRFGERVFDARSRRRCGLAHRGRSRNRASRPTAVPARRPTNASFAMACKLKANSSFEVQTGGSATSRHKSCRPARGGGDG